jgi:hypothetical protein
MRVLAVMMFVMVAMHVGAPLGLERELDVLKVCSQAREHVFDHVVGPNPKNVGSNLRRQMTIAQVPGKAHQLCGIFMSDFYKSLQRGPNL